MARYKIHCLRDMRLYPHTFFSRTIKLLKFKNGNRLTNRVKCPKDVV